MCEAQGHGALGSPVEASPSPERLSVSSSSVGDGSQDSARHSLTSSSSSGGESSEETALRETQDSSVGDTSNTSKCVLKEDPKLPVSLSERTDEEEEKVKEYVKKEVVEVNEKNQDVRDENCGKHVDEKDGEAVRDGGEENTAGGEEKNKNISDDMEENRPKREEEATPADSAKDKEEERDENKENEGIEKLAEEEAEENKENEEIEKVEEGGKKEQDKTEEEEEEEEEGVDPFSPKNPAEEATSPRKVLKTVNFLDDAPRTITTNGQSRNSANTSTSSSSKVQTQEEEEEEEEDVGEEGRGGGGEAEEKQSRQWALGEGNPVYRLSLKLSPNLFHMTDIPGANQHKEAEKAGYLTKLSGRSFPYIAQWKRRYCVLSKGRLYYYEKEDSKAGDKSNGVIQLEYFDQVTEAGPKECKKATNVFIITSQDRSFFDPGRHLFSADTLPEMKDWIRRLQAALDQIRNNNRPPNSTSPSASPSTKEGGKRRREETAESKDSKGNQTQNTSSKERKKKKEESTRSRKSARVGVSSQTQTSMVEPTTCEPDGGRPVSSVPRSGVMLPGLSARKDPRAQAVKRSSSQRDVAEQDGAEGTKEELPQAGPTLTCVTKMRVKGPSGRRAPQNRRQTAAALKKRASSLSALEHQDANDNRSENSEGATCSYRDSQTPEGDLNKETENKENNGKKTYIEEEEEEETHEHTPERSFTISNIENDLFFKRELTEGGRISDRESQKNRRTLKVNFEENRSSTLKNGTLSKFLKFKDVFATEKRGRFSMKGTVGSEHPDMMENSRWSCAIL